MWSFPLHLLISENNTMHINNCDFLSLSCLLVWPWTYCVAETILELLILLPSPHNASITGVCHLAPCKPTCILFCHIKILVFPFWYFGFLLALYFIFCNVVIVVVAVKWVNFYVKDFSCDSFTILQCYVRSRFLKIALSQLIYPIALSAYVPEFFRVLCYLCMN